MMQATDMDFRGAMRRLTTTVNIVTVADGGQRFGMTATAVTSVCADPATMLVCINNATSIYEPLTRSGLFCINMLRVGQEDISAGFSGKLKGEARFAVGDWHATAENLPFLADAQANIFCRTASTLSYGTHVIFIAAVIDVRIAEEIAPLLYEDGRYVRSTYL